MANIKSVSVGPSATSSKKVAFHPNNRGVVPPQAPQEASIDAVHPSYAGLAPSQPQFTGAPRSATTKKVGK